MAGTIMMYGGTGGIGEACAREFRGRGYGLHLVARSEKTAAAIAAGHPLPRLGAAQDIAALTAFLVSSDADWITGQVIGVDGGRSTIAGQG